MIRRLALAILCVSSIGVAARAADLPTDHFQPTPPKAPPAPVIYDMEILFGGYAHDYSSPEGGSGDLNVELHLPKFYHISNGFWDQFIPRPAVGITANFVGKTSVIYGGAAWNFDITQRVFLGAEFGPSVNNGKTGDVVPDGHNAVGCNVMFHESATAGYRLTPEWSVMATVEHPSNASLCDRNRGLTNYGLRLGYRF